MKKLYLLILLFLITNTLHAQLPLSYAFNNRDDVSYKGADSGIKTYSWNNGVLYLGFCYDSLMTKEGFSIIFYDTLGTKLWTKKYYSNVYRIYQANDIIAFNNSSFYIGGIVYKDSVNQYDRLFAKFNSYGDTVFTRIYPDAEINYVMDLEAFSMDTILMLSAKTLSNADPFTKAIICKTDTLGNILSTYEGMNSLAIPGQIVRSDNNIYVGGTYSTGYGANGTYNLKVLINIFDLDLNYLYSWNPSNTLNETFAKMIIKDNIIYLVRDISVVNPGYGYYFYQTSISKHLLNGTYITSANFGPMNIDGATGSFIKLDNHKFLLQIYSTLYFIDTTLALICHSNDICDTNFYRNYGGISVLPNKMLAATGGYYQTDTLSSQDHWNFLTENIDNYITNLINLNVAEVKTSNSSFIVYPNPASVNITIDIKQYFDFRNTTLSIYNIQGQQIHQQKIYQSKTELDVSKFPKGMYVVKLSNNKDVKLSKFVKE